MNKPRLALLLLSFVLVAACGTKGDLVPPPASAPATQADTPAA